MRNLSITIDSNGKVKKNPYNLILGYGGEHNATTINVEFLDFSSSVFANADYFRFVFDGYYSEDLYLTENTLAYTIPAEAIVPPTVHCQLIGYKSGENDLDMIAKSEVFEYEVGFSEVPFSKVNNKTDIFERTLEQCRAFSEKAENNAEVSNGYSLSAKEHADTALAAADNTSSLHQQCEKFSITASNYAAAAAVSAAEAEISADVVNEVKALPKNTSNAIKQTINGKAIFVNNVSPLTHELEIDALIDELETSEITRIYKYNETDGKDFLYFRPELDTTDSTSYVHLNQDLILDAESIVIDAAYKTSTSVLYYFVRISKKTSDFEVYYYDANKPNVRNDINYYDISINDFGLPYVLPSPEILSILSYNAEVVKIEQGVETNVVVCGRNLLPFAENTNSFAVNWLNFSTIDGNVFLSGHAQQDISFTNESFKTNFAIDVPAGEYYLSYYGGILDIEAVIADMDGNEVCRLDFSNGRINTQVTIQEGKQYYLGFEIKSSTMLKDYIVKLMLELQKGDEYESCKPRQETIIYNNDILDRLHSVSPFMIVFGSNALSVKYNVDINKMPYEDNALKSNTVKGAIGELFSFLPKCNFSGQVGLIKDSLNLKPVSIKLKPEISNPSLKFYGKNVFNYKNAIVQMDNGSFKRIENGFYVLGVDGGYENGANYSNGKIFIKPRDLPIAPKYTISMDYEILSEQRPEMNRISLQTENYQQHFLEVSVGDKGRMSITVSPFNRMSVCVGGHGVNLTNIQVELSDVESEYEPYIAPQSVTIPYDFTTGDTVSVENGKANINYLQYDEIITENDGKELFSLVGWDSKWLYLNQDLIVGASSIEATITGVCTYCDEPLGNYTVTINITPKKEGVIGSVSYVLNSNYGDDFNLTLDLVGGNINKTTGFPTTIYIASVEEPYYLPLNITSYIATVKKNNFVLDITDAQTGKELLDLNTLYPSTSVISDCEAEIVYCADIKNYIDCKLQGLQAAMLSNGF